MSSSNHLFSKDLEQNEIHLSDTQKIIYKELRNTGALSNHSTINHEDLAKVMAYAESNHERQIITNLKKVFKDSPSELFKIASTYDFPHLASVRHYLSLDIKAEASTDIPDIIVFHAAGTSPTQESNNEEPGVIAFHATNDFIQTSSSFGDEKKDSSNSYSSYAPFIQDLAALIRKTPEEVVALQYEEPQQFLNIVSASTYIKEGLLAVETVIKLSKAEVDVLNQLSSQRDTVDKQTFIEMLRATGIRIETQRQMAEQKIDAQRVATNNVNADNNKDTEFELGCKEFQDKNYSQAFALFQKAARRDHSDAQNYLGFLYHYGKGVKPNQVEAFYWYSKSARQGNATAQYNLGIYLVYVFVDDTKNAYDDGIEWFYQAAIQGCVQAQYELATRYFNEYKSFHDSRLAAKWMRIAAIEKYENAYNKMMDAGKYDYHHIPEVTYHYFMMLFTFGKLYPNVIQRFQSLFKEQPLLLKQLLDEETVETLQALRNSHVIDNIVDEFDAQEGSLVQDMLYRKMGKVSEKTRKRTEMPQGVAQHILSFLEDPARKNLKNLRLVKDSKISKIRIEKDFQELCKKRIAQFEKYLADTQWNISKRGLVGLLGFNAYSITLSNQQTITVPRSIFLQWTSAVKHMENSDPVKAWDEIVYMARIPRHFYDEDNAQVKEFFDKFRNEGSIRVCFDSQGSLMTLVNKGDNDIVTSLIELNLHNDKFKEINHTPLTLTCRNADYVNSKLLIQYGANLEAKDNDRKATALAWAMNAYGTITGAQDNTTKEAAEGRLWDKSSYPELKENAIKIILKLIDAGANLNDSSVDIELKQLSTDKDTLIAPLIMYLRVFNNIQNDSAKRSEAASEIAQIYGRLKYPKKERHFDNRALELRRVQGVIYGPCPGLQEVISIVN